MTCQELATALFSAVESASGKTLAASITEVPGAEYFPSLESVPPTLAAELDTVADDCGEWLATHGSSEVEISPADLITAIDNVQHGTELCPGIKERLGKI